MGLDGVSLSSGTWYPLHMLHYKTHHSAFWLRMMETIVQHIYEDSARAKAGIAENEIEMLFRIQESPETITILFIY